MLWARLQDESLDSLTIQNTMRRILEQYFKLFGNRGLEAIPDQFEGPQRLACSALLSWVNVGSHSIVDDICVVQTMETIDMFRHVFRTIFENTHHLAHYEMMMGIEDSGTTDATTAQPASSGQAAVQPDGLPTRSGFLF